MQAADSSHRLPAHSVVAPLDLLASPSARVHLLLAPSLALLDCQSASHPFSSPLRRILGPWNCCRPATCRAVHSRSLPRLLCDCVTALVTAASIPLPIRTLRCLALRCLPFLTYSPCFILDSYLLPSPSPLLSLSLSLSTLLPFPLSRYHPGDPHRVDSALKAASVARPAAS